MAGTKTVETCATCQWPRKHSTVPSGGPSFFFRHNLGVLRVGKFEMAREGRNWIPTFSDVAVFV